MVDLLSTQEPLEPQVYRPISGLALTGFVVGAIYAAIVLFTTLIALAQGQPSILPGWTLGIAVVAAVLCFTAQVRIANAEGTLAGLLLARWGLWLSILLGLTYFVYSWVTGLALTKQANDFLTVRSDDDSGFFPRLKNAAKNRTDFYHAFLLTKATTQRGGSNPANEEAMLGQFDRNPSGDAGEIANFRRHPLVMAVMQDPETIIEPLGVVEWKYEQGAYHVLRNYRLTTKEVEFEIAIPVRSTEATGAGEQRKWYVGVASIPRFTPAKYTARGTAAYGLRRHSKEFLEQWRLALAGGRPAPQFKEADTDWTRILPQRELQREHVRTALGEIFRAERKAPPQMSLVTDDSFEEWKAVEGRIHIAHPVRMMLPPTDRYPPFNVDLEVHVATRDLIDIAAPVPKQPAWTWEIRKIVVKRAAVAEKGKGPM
jgi:hypothetical protein